MFKQGVTLLRFLLLLINVKSRVKARREYEHTPHRLNSSTQASGPRRALKPKGAPILLLLCLLRSNKSSVARPEKERDQIQVIQLSWEHQMACTTLWTRALRCFTATMTMNGKRLPHLLLYIVHKYNIVHY